MPRGQASGLKAVGRDERKLIRVLPATTPEGGYPYENF